MHPKSDNIEIMVISDEADEVIEEFFDSLKNIYQRKLETKMRNSKFVFYYVYLLYHKSHRINFNHGGPYIGQFG